MSKKKKTLKEELFERFDRGDKPSQIKMKGVTPGTIRQYYHRYRKERGLVVSKEEQRRRVEAPLKAKIGRLETDIAVLKVELSVKRTKNFAEGFAEIGGLTDEVAGLKTGRDANLAVISKLKKELAEEKAEKLVLVEAVRRIRQENAKLRESIDRATTWIANKVRKFLQPPK